MILRLRDRKGQTKVLALPFNSYSKLDESLSGRIRPEIRRKHGSLLRNSVHCEMRRGSEILAHVCSAINTTEGWSRQAIGPPYHLIVAGSPLA